jgi:hypothetical protein
MGQLEKPTKGRAYLSRVIFTAIGTTLPVLRLGIVAVSRCSGVGLIRWFLWKWYLLNFVGERTVVLVGMFTQIEQEESPEGAEKLPPFPTGSGLSSNYCVQVIQIVVQGFCELTFSEQFGAMFNATSELFHPVDFFW